ncbi:MAG: MFS transporter [Clostridiales bacterium]|nr:MFS transporter [Clostridiales bacterium]
MNKSAVHLRLRSPFTNLYDEAGLTPDFRRSLNFIFLGNLCGTICGIVCTSGSTAMVGLASSLGAGDLAFGIMAALMQASALLQIPFSMLVNKTHKRKKYLLTFGLISRAIWLLFGMIPLIIPSSPSWLRLYSLIFLLGASSFLGAAINVCWFPWFSDLTPISIRGRWLSIRDTVISFVSVGMGLVIARLLDTLPPETRYLVVFMIGGLFGMFDMISFGFCKEVYSAPPQKLHIKKVMTDMFHDRPFVHFLIMWTAWCFTANMGGVYMTPYAMNVMGLSATQIMLFATIAASVATILCISRWGKAMDRYGCKSVMLVTCVVASLTPAFYVFQTPGSIWPTLLHNFFGAVFWCGANLAANSMQLSSSPDDLRPTYIAVFSCVTALVGGTLGSLTGGTILEFCETQGWFVGWFDRYKALFVLEVILRLGFVLLFVPKLSNDKEGTSKDLLKGIFSGHLAKHE